MTFNVLIVDDEIHIQQLFKRALNKDKYLVTGAIDAKHARQELAQKKFRIALIDLMLPDASGLDLLADIRIMQPDCRCIMMTGFSSTKTAVQSIRLGAHDYLEKPFGPLSNVLELIDNAVGINGSKDDSNEWNRIQMLAIQAGMISGTNPQVKQLITTAYKLANKNISVLITGETGTGKEVLAKFIHNAGKRANNNFIPINCGAISENLLESELFGHEKGAFTGAAAVKRGVFELADKGTLFMDELAEASSGIQVKLLRVLETSAFMRVGGEKLIQTDVRFISATNANLKDLVAQKTFRADLYYRLDVVCLEMEPLRRRIEDIPELVNYFTEKISYQNNISPTPVFSQGALALLMNYSWPGNIRELYNVIQQILVQDVPSLVSEYYLPPKILSPNLNERFPEKIYHPTENTPLPDLTFYPRSLEEIEKEFIQKTISYFQGNITLSAKALGLSRATLYRKLKNPHMSK